jgi:hypothetical protein
MADVLAPPKREEAGRPANVSSAPGKTRITKTMEFSGRFHVILRRVGKAKTSFAKKSKNNVDTLSRIQVKTTSSS